MRFLYYLADGAAMVIICYLSVFAAIFSGDALIKSGLINGLNILGFVILFFLSGMFLGWLWYRFSPVSSRKIRQPRKDKDI